MASSSAARLNAAVISAAETPAPWLSGSTYIFDSSTAGRSVTARCDIVVVGHAANQHDIAHHSRILARGEHHAIGIGEVVAEPVLGQVLVDERGDVLRRDRRRTRQRKRAGGDVGEFGQIGDDGRGDVNGRNTMPDSGHVPLRQVLAGDLVEQHHVGDRGRGSSPTTRRR